MTRMWNNPDREPTPEQVAAWFDGELDWQTARQVESWLTEHPDQVHEADSLRQVVHLYRDHTPDNPSNRDWQSTLDAIEARVQPQVPTSKSRPRWWPRLILGLITTAAAGLGAMVTARTFWEQPQPQQPAGVVQNETNDVFDVARASEVHIIHVDVKDADRVVLGVPLMGSFELATPEDIEVLKIEPHPEEGTKPRLERRPGVPMIVIAQFDEEP